MNNFEVDASNPGGGVYRLKHIMVNSYLIGKPGGSNWIALDAGLARFCSKKIFNHAEKNFGRNARPAAIVLTHGHMDHVGAIFRLAEQWQVPVYAHKLELPFLTGKADYQRPDWRAGGGFMAWTSFVF